MKSIRTKITVMTLCTTLIALSIATAIGVISIQRLGRNDADQMFHLTAKTGAMNLETYFESVEQILHLVILRRNTIDPAPLLTFLDLFDPVSYCFVIGDHPLFAPFLSEDTVLLPHPPVIFLLILVLSHCP